MTLHSKILLSTALWLSPFAGSGLVCAQESEPRGEAGADGEDPSRETDISEDNYRRFMELDDRRLERPAFPVSGMAPTTGLQKMGQLPESSQKHLRNQLRGIILSRGAWTPAERDAPYSFAPSAQARGDAQLLRQEAEAWAELVNEYHDREAAILAGTAAPPAGQEGASSPGQPASGEPAGNAPEQQANAGTGQGGNPGSQGQAGGQEGQGSQEGQAGAQGENGEDGGPDSRSGSSSNTETPPQRPKVPDQFAEDGPTSAPTAPSNEGVEQNASAYLEARGLGTPAPADLQVTGSGSGTDTPASAAEERESRWGDEAQTLLRDREPADNPARQRGTIPRPADRPEEAIPANSLTRDELRRARGITGEPPPPEDAFEDFEGGGLPMPVEDKDEAPPGDEAGPDPDEEDRDGP